jgi:hypothetical protein
VLAVHNCVRKKPVDVRRDTTEEVPETENNRPLQLNELRSVTDGSVKVGIAGCAHSARWVALDLAAAWRLVLRGRTKVSSGVHLTQLARGSRALQAASP